MKKKALQLFEISKADILKLWNKDYNSKASTQIVILSVAGHETSSFDDFLIVDDSDSFDTSVFIN